MKNYLLIAVVLFLSFSSFTVYAGSFTWSGGSSDWSDTTVWTPYGVPSAGDTVILSSPSNENELRLTKIELIGKFTIISGTLNLNSYTINISATCNFVGGIINDGHVRAYGSSPIAFEGTEFNALFMHQEVLFFSMVPYLMIL
jgi:hypothetical protein